MQVIEMLKVGNVKCINRLSQRSLRSSRTRNIVAVIAIMLTAVMFTSLFTISMSMMDSLQLSTMRQVGTKAHAGFKFITMDQYEKVKADPEVKDISYSIMVGTGENEELLKTYTEIRYTEPKAAEWGFTMPTTGRLPEKGMELAAATAVLDALGVPHKLGENVTLEFTAKGVKHKDTFTLCGFWEQDKTAMANEAFVSREYCDSVVDVWQDEANKGDDWTNIEGSVNPSFWFDSSWDIEGQVEALKERCGFGKEVNEGVNWAYASSSVDATTAALVIGVLAVIILSGYLIIYNIFYISVTADIRFYGLLKTIGTTGKQLKKIVRRQALLLSCMGIPAGLALGYGISYILMPIVIKASDLGGDNMVISLNPLIFIGSGLFSLVTVWISCIRPCRLVKKITPVEAVKYTESTNETQKIKRRERKSKRVTPLSMAIANLGRNRKKTVSVVLSICLSIIMMGSSVTVAQGFDMDKYLESKMVTDFYVTDATVDNVTSQYNEYAGVSEEDRVAFSKIDGITGIGSVYMLEGSHKTEGRAAERAKKIFEEHKDIVPIDEYLKTLEKEINENHTLPSHLYGISTFLWDKVEIFDGRFDKEKFATGNYVIASAFSYNGDNTGKESYYNVGEKVKIEFSDGTYKEYEVMALGEMPDALGPQHGHWFEVDFILPEDEFIERTGETGALRTAFDVEEAYDDAVSDFMNDYCSNVKDSLTCKSRQDYADEFKSMNQTFLTVGLALSFILALIALLNFINAVITSIQSRKNELAILQSIGMTGKQLKSMLIWEGLLYIAISLVLALTAGTLLTYLLVKAITSQMWMFTYHFIIWPQLAAVPVSLIFAWLIPTLCYKNMCRSSIVERLRMAE